MRRVLLAILFFGFSVDVSAISFQDEIDGLLRAKKYVEAEKQLENIINQPTLSDDVFTAIDRLASLYESGSIKKKSVRSDRLAFDVRRRICNFPVPTWGPSKQYLDGYFDRVMGVAHSFVDEGCAWKEYFQNLDRPLKDLERVMNDSSKREEAQRARLHLLKFHREKNSEKKQIFDQEIQRLELALSIIDEKRKKEAEVERQRQTDAAIKIQKMGRGFLAKQVLDRLKQDKAATLLQSSARRFLAWKELKKLKQEKAATTVQKTWRGFKVRRDGGLEAQRQYNLSRYAAAGKIWQAWLESNIPAAMYRKALRNIDHIAGVIQPEDILLLNRASQAGYMKARSYLGTHMLVSPFAQQASGMYGFETAYVMLEDAAPYCAAAASNALYMLHYGFVDHLFDAEAGRVTQVQTVQEGVQKRLEAMKNRHQRVRPAVMARADEIVSHLKEGDPNYHWLNGFFSWLNGDRETAVNHFSEVKGPYEKEARLARLLNKNLSGVKDGKTRDQSIKMLEALLSNEDLQPEFIPDIFKALFEAYYDKTMSVANLLEMPPSIGKEKNVSRFIENISRLRGVLEALKMLDQEIEGDLADKFNLATVRLSLGSEDREEGIWIRAVRVFEQNMETALKDPEAEILMQTMGLLHVVDALSGEHNAMLIVALMYSKSERFKDAVRWFEKVYKNDQNPNKHRATAAIGIIETAIQCSEIPGNTAATEENLASAEELYNEAILLDQEVKVPARVQEFLGDRARARRAHDEALAFYELCLNNEELTFSRKDSPAIKMPRIQQKAAAHSKIALHHSESLVRKKECLKALVSGKLSEEDVAKKKAEIKTLRSQIKEHEKRADEHFEKARGLYNDLATKRDLAPHVDADKIRTVIGVSYLDQARCFGQSDLLKKAFSIFQEIEKRNVEALMVSPDVIKFMARWYNEQKKDYKKSAQWCVHQIEDIESPAQYRALAAVDLARFYMNGQVTPANGMSPELAAFELLEWSVLMTPTPAALHNTGLFYELGVGCQVDLAIACDMYVTAASMKVDYVGGKDPVTHESIEHLQKIADTQTDSQENGYISAQAKYGLAFIKYVRDGVRDMQHLLADFTDEQLAVFDDHMLPGSADADEFVEKVEAYRESKKIQQIPLEEKKEQDVLPHYLSSDVFDVRSALPHELSFNIASRLEKAGRMDAAIKWYKRSIGAPLSPIGRAGRIDLVASKLRNAYNNSQNKHDDRCDRQLILENSVALYKEAIRLFEGFFEDKKLSSDTPLKLAVACNAVSALAEPEKYKEKAFGWAKKAEKTLMSEVLKDGDVMRILAEAYRKENDIKKEVAYLSQILKAPKASVYTKSSAALDLAYYYRDEMVSPKEGTTKENRFFELVKMAHECMPTGTSFYHLAECFQDGIGVAQDIKKAISLYTASVIAGQEYTLEEFSNRGKRKEIVARFVDHKDLSNEEKLWARVCILYLDKIKDDDVNVCAELQKLTLEQLEALNLEALPVTRIEKVVSAHAEVREAIRKLIDEKKSAQA